MECPECSWFQFWLGIIIGAIVTSAVSFFTLWLIKHPLKSKIEKIFKKNTEYLDQQYFYYLSRIDSYKMRIYEQLKSNPKFNPDIASAYEYAQPIYDEILRYRDLISKEIEIIQSFKKLSGDVDLKHFLKIQQYTTTAYLFIGEIGNQDNSLFYAPIVLERHRFYAKEIVLSFGRSATGFNSQWKSNFLQVGGINNVAYPTLEPGDDLGIDLNMNNELLLWDPQFSTLLKTIRELKPPKPPDD